MGFLCISCKCGYSFTVMCICMSVCGKKECATTGSQLNARFWPPDSSGVSQAPGPVRAAWSHNPSLCPAGPGLAASALAQWALETRAAGAPPRIFPGRARGPQETERDVKGGAFVLPLVHSCLPWTNNVY